MKKLEDIPKKEIFEVPEGYFEKLPGIIQARVSERQSSLQFSFARFSIRYVLPAFLLIAGATFWFTKISLATDAETLLADIETEALVAYLDDSDLSTDELLDNATLLDQFDAEDIEDEVYGLPFTPEETEELINDIDL
jgi:hypothetical protein